MTDQEQFDAINQRQWYTDLRTQLGAILTAMAQTGFTVDDGGWVKSAVAGIPVRFQMQPGGKHAVLEAGVSAAGEPIFTWDFPTGWVTS